MSADGLGASTPAHGYSGDDLAAHAKVAAVYNSLLVSVFVLAQRSPKASERLTPYDVLLIGLATHKISRLISRDRFNAPIRSPFVRYGSDAGAGEVNEHPRGTGLRLAVGQLLSHPACTGPFVAPLLTLGMVRVPQASRLVCSTFSAITISDLLHRAYEAMKARSPVQEEQG